MRKLVKLLSRTQDFGLNTLAKLLQHSLFTECNLLPYCMHLQKLLTQYGLQLYGITFPSWLASWLAIGVDRHPLTSVRSWLNAQHLRRVTIPINDSNDTVNYVVGNTKHLRIFYHSPFTSWIWNKIMAAFQKFSCLPIQSNPSARNGDAVTEWKLWVSIHFIEHNMHSYRTRYSYNYLGWQGDRAMKDFFYLLQQHLHHHRHHRCHHSHRLQHHLKLTVTASANAIPQSLGKSKWYYE